MSTPLSNGLSIILTSLRAQNEGAEVVLLFRIESGEQSEQKRLVISTEQYSEIKPKRGEVTPEEFDKLEAAAMLYSAVRRGEGILSYSSNSARRLTQKLSQKGYDRATAEQAAGILREKGFIDEKKDAEREVERCVRKLWGAARIRAHLWSKGFDKAVLSELDGMLSEVDFSENCAELIRKKYCTPPTDPAEHRRMVAALARYGYSIGEIKEAISKIK